MFSHTQQQLDKRRFILQMGSYYLQAKGEGKDDEFFNVVFVHYCDRWPIDTTKYFDAEFMESDMKRQKATLVKSIKDWAGMAFYEADKLWSDLFKYQQPQEKLGPCVQDLLDAGVVERVNSDNVEGHADEYSAIMGGTYSDPIDVDSAMPIQFAPTPVHALPPRPRPRPRIHSRKARNVDNEGYEYIRGPVHKEMVIDPNVIEL